jgi:hypothetical protein
MLPSRDGRIAHVFDRVFGVQAVVAEYAVTTMFLFITIGTVSSNWYAKLET